MAEARKIESDATPQVEAPRGLLGRAWLAVPAWAFQAAGALVFLGYVATQLPAYFTDFNRVGLVYFNTPDDTWYVPWGKVLVDLNFLIIGLAFIFRAPAKRVVSRPRDIIIPVIAAFWPMFPFWVLGALSLLAGPAIGIIDPRLPATLRDFMFDAARWTQGRFIAGAGLIVVGNALDVWAYATLFRSISIVPEARELKTGGPYRFVRHPVYFGQMLAQGGVWLVLARTHVVWIAFYLGFVAMQLHRSRLEENVLERHFGEDYRAYRKRAIWFWR